MSKGWSKLFRVWKRKKSKAPGKDRSHDSFQEQGQPVSPDLTVNLTCLQGVLGHSNDLVIRQFTIGSAQPVAAAVVFIDGLVNSLMVNESIMKPLLLEMRKVEDNGCKQDFLTEIKDTVLSVGQLYEVSNLPDILDGVLTGDTALILDGYSTALLLGTRAWESRGVQEPNTEAVIRGPREGFTETLRVNTSLLRRKIKTPNLHFEQLKLGKQTKTEVCIAYIKGLANEKIVAEVRRRLQGIDVDSILESGYIEEFIEDAPFSPFATVGNSEKPDVTAAKMLEGRVGILVDGTPFVLTVPYIFIESLQASEDYYSRPFYATIVRWIRMWSLACTALLPAVYIALQTFHQEMIPTSLLISMAAAREGVPFPAFAEAFFMGLIFEVLREAGVRMPRSVGQAVSIVGALVLGEAAVQAGLVSTPMVIVVAVTGITGFIVPPQTDAITIFRLGATVLAAVLGFYGVLLCILALFIHLTALRSFGVPYLSPLAPSSILDLKDVLVRAPRWSMLTRPRAIPGRNWVRQAPFQYPQPPSDEEKEIIHHEE